MKRDIQFESIQSKVLLNPVKAPSMPFDWSINPYRGCQHGCSFCYARSTHAFLGIETDDTFQNHILMKMNAYEVLENQLKKLTRPGSKLDRNRHVAIGTATDPYQPIEAKAKLTRSCLELLAAYGVPVSVTTRSPLILRDIDLLRQLSLISINISLSTMDHQIWKAFEPSTPSPAKRLETVKALASEGLPVGVFMAPILPYLTDTDDELKAVMMQASRHGASFVMSSSLRLSTPPVKTWFMRTIEEHYPQLSGKYETLYANSGNAPTWYLNPLRSRLHGIRKELGLLDDMDKHPKPPLLPPPARETPPEQLSFSF